MQHALRGLAGFGSDMQVPRVDEDPTGFRSGGWFALHVVYCTGFVFVCCRLQSKSDGIVWHLPVAGTCPVGVVELCCDEALFSLPCFAGHLLQQREKRRATGDVKGQVPRC